MSASRRLAGARDFDEHVACSDRTGPCRWLLSYSWLSFSEFKWSPTPSTVTVVVSQLDVALCDNGVHSKVMNYCLIALPSSSTFGRHPKADRHR